MNVLDEIVEKLGGYDQLKPDEKTTYQEHLKIIEGKPISVDDTKAFVRNMINVIEKALVDTKEYSPESRSLKARLKNFLVLEQFLYSPERARAALERFYQSR
ncbi:MAG: hypothetical protein WA019_04050 [Candidatus Moraniibacteriota bacterium]